VPHTRSTSYDRGERKGTAGDHPHRGGCLCVGCAVGLARDDGPRVPRRGERGLL